jgi:UDP-glucose 4-epimerase
MKNKRIVITGGAGFIGSNLAEELSAHNQVIIIDDLSSGRIENIQHLLNKGNATFIQGSITELPLLQAAFKDVDFVFHQAAMASVSGSIEDPLLCHEVNAKGTLNVLVAARDNHVRKIVFASSCAVYGDSPVLPKTEDMPPEPQSPYAVTKLTGEHYCQVFSSVYGLPTACLRYFNVYGPRQDPSSDYAAVIPRFITRALQNQPLIIFGDGDQTRDFVFIRDVVGANLLAAEGKALGICNVGSGESISVNMLAAAISDILGRKLDIVHQTPRSGEVRHSRADISTARAMGYRPQYSLQAGLTATIAHFSRATA